MKVGEELTAVRVADLGLRVPIGFGVLAVTSRGHADGFF